MRGLSREPVVLSMSAFLWSGSLKQEHFLRVGEPSDGGGSRVCPRAQASDAAETQQCKSSKHGEVDQTKRCRERGGEFGVRAMPSQLLIVRRGLDKAAIHP